MVRSSGFEPPRYCYRQPLKLVRLPVPPRPPNSILNARNFVCQFNCDTRRTAHDSLPLCASRLQS